MVIVRPPTAKRPVAAIVGRLPWFCSWTRTERSAPVRRVACGLRGPRPPCRRRRRFPPPSAPPAAFRIVAGLLIRLTAAGLASERSPPSTGAQSRCRRGRLVATSRCEPIRIRDPTSRCPPASGYPGGHIAFAASLAFAARDAFGHGNFRGGAPACGVPAAGDVGPAPWLLCSAFVLPTLALAGGRFKMGSSVALSSARGRPCSMPVKCLSLLLLTSHSSGGSVRTTL